MATLEGELSFATFLKFQSDNGGTTPKRVYHLSVIIDPISPPHLVEAAGIAPASYHIPNQPIYAHCKRRVCGTSISKFNARF